MIVAEYSGDAQAGRNRDINYLLYMNPTLFRESVVNITFIILASLLGALSVALGAFGAHALRRRLPQDRLETFETAARYQMYHALALLAAGLSSDRFARPGLVLAAGWLFIAGIALFSGSLYLLVFSGNRRWGAVAPLGGLCFIAAWICLGIAAL